MDSLAITLILTGAGILFLAILKTRKVFPLLEKDNFRSGWRRLVFLISLFELGYIGMVFLILQYQHQFLLPLTGIIFFTGSIFVFIAVSMAVKTFQMMKDSNKAVEAQMKILKTRNSQLIQFNYATTHDLREPINTVLGCSSLLESDYLQLLDEDGQKLIHFTKKAAYRMSELVSALSDYLSVGLEFKREEVDVNGLVKEVIESMNGSVENADAVIEVGSMPKLKANKNELKRVFQNLIGNSIKYKRVDASPQIIVSAEKAGGSWQFSVKDNGIGINEKDIPRAFQLFRQLHAKDTYEGMGLGLSIAKRVIELHGGKIWLESTIGQGTTFFFTLHDN